MNTINFHKTAIAAILSLMLTLPSYAADYQYDDLNRLIKVAYNSGQIIEYSYDSAGNMTSIDTNMQPKPKQNALTVSSSGTGKGTVISSPSGINCGNTCSYSYPANTRVTLTPKPMTGSKFEGWRGACSGSGACQITLSSDQKVTATFVRIASGTPVTNVASGKWTRSGSPYLIKGDIQVPKGQQLTIEPGVEVRFDGHYKFVVEGSLNAVGTSDAKVVFTRNRDTDDSRGWGIRFINSENVSRLAYCTVEYGYADNGKWDSSQDDRGAGIAIVNSSVTIEDCLIKNNKATTGAGIYIASRKPTLVRRNVIVDNVAFNHGYNACGGGGIAVGSSSDEVVVENNIIARNAYSGNARNYEGGGGLSLGYGNAKVVNNTIFGNSSPKGSGIHTSRGYKGLIQNNIIWGNIGSKNGEQVSVQKNNNTTAPLAAVTIQHNIIQSRGIVVLSRNDFQANFSGRNNISIDPRFVNTEKYDFHLQANSPAIDRGASQNAPKTDLEGYSRPNGRGYDIGAYEYGSQTNPDKDGDGVPDKQDAFPNDPTESVDTDNDGKGNNADPDDDGDGLPDDYEAQYAFLNPLDSSDAAKDEDGDGISNLDEYKQGTNPAIADNQLFSISGTVKGPHGNPMSNVIVTLKNSHGDSMTYTTKTEGTYAFKDLPAGNYQMSASGDKLDVADHRGVTEDDANRIRDHILARVRLVDSIQCVAADVNQDNDMDVADIINIQRYLKTDPDWYVDWLFITNSNFTCRSLGKKETVLRFDNLASNQTQQDFIGIRMGDVDHSWFGKNQDSDICKGNILQVAVDARNPTTGECKQFGTRCQVPSGWLTLPLGEKCESSNEKPKPIDTDGDGISDDVDTDDDGDGVADAKDVFPLDTKESVDTDGDGTGNNADTDDDGDGVADAKDAFPLDAKESVDTDGDGTGNNADTDDDGDGVADAKDAFPLDANESVDTDGDGTGNNADTDDDGDGINDLDNLILVKENGVWVKKQSFEYQLNGANIKIEKNSATFLTYRYTKLDLETAFNIKSDSPLIEILPTSEDVIRTAEQYSAVVSVDGSFTLSVGGQAFTNYRFPIGTKLAMDRETISVEFELNQPLEF